MRFTASAFLGLALLLYGDVSWGHTEPTPPQDQPSLTEKERQEAEAKKRMEEDEAKAWSQIFFEEFLLRSCDDPTLESAIALPQPKMTLEASDDGKTTAKARVGFNIKRTIVLNLEVKSPRDSSGKTDLVSLDGLSNGSNAELKLSWFNWKPRTYTSEGLATVWRKVSGRRTPNKEIRADQVYCRIQDLIPGSPSTEEVKCKEDTNAEKDSGDTSGATNADGQMTAYLKPAISRPSATAMLASSGKTDYKEAAEIYRDWLRYYDKFLPVLTLNAKANQQEFQFFLPSAGPPAGLRKTAESQTNYQITGSAGAYLWGRFYSSLNYRRGTQYTDGDTQEFCTPTGAARILDCIKPVIAPPKKRQPEALEFEIRGLAGSLGLAAHVTRDLEANVTIVELPVYILQKLGTSQMELNLGARAQWRSDTKDVALSVFVGPALSTVLRMLNN